MLLLGCQGTTLQDSRHSLCPPPFCWNLTFSNLTILTNSKKPTAASLESPQLSLSTPLFAYSKWNIQGDAVQQTPHPCHPQTQGNCFATSEATKKSVPVPRDRSGAAFQTLCLFWVIPALWTTSTCWSACGQCRGVVWSCFIPRVSLAFVPIACPSASLCC